MTFPLTEDARERAWAALAETLGDMAFDCKRVWQAWGVGTMSADDFELIREDTDRLDELSRAVLDAVLPTLPAILVKAGYVVMPRALTAENGAKAELSCEFHESIEVACPECDEEFDCELCDNERRLTEKVPVSWDNIKAIYARAVSLLAVEPPTLAPLKIVEEVPCCEPHWFVTGILNVSGDSPKFDTHAGAVAFCEALGRPYTTEYFTP